MEQEELLRIIEQARLDHETHLDLGFCQIEDLPREIGQLTDLTFLNLSSNRLTSLPNEIGDLTDLAELDLRNNNLGELPFEISFLGKLQKLHVRGNPLGIPIEIIEESTDPAILIATIFGYSTENWEEEVVVRKKRRVIFKRKQLREAKVLLVGQGSVGKTSLIKE